jgi:beta-glucosidase
VTLETILALPSVKAIVWAGLPGQESGNALVDVLYGAVSPSGKLPYTIAKAAGDYGATWNDAQVDDFTEGLFIDYRHFDQNGITPRYEFGYGLSYTKFDYAGITVDVFAQAGPSTGKVIPGGPADLFKSVGTVSTTVRNTGKVAGAEIAQLYIGLPNSAPSTPPKQLRGFQKLRLEPRQSSRVTFELTRRDLSYWDVTTQKWVVPTGKFRIYVGSSSRDIRQHSSFTVGDSWGN